MVAFSYYRAYGEIFGLKRIKMTKQNKITAF